MNLHSTQYQIRLGKLKLLKSDIASLIINLYLDKNTFEPTLARYLFYLCIDITNIRDIKAHLT